MNRNQGLVILRAVSAFFIVGCHLGLKHRTILAGYMTHFCDLHVGVFAAISGYLMAISLAKTESGLSVVQYIMKRCRRLLAVYLGWSLFFIVSSAIFSFVFKGKIDFCKYSDMGYWWSVLWRGNASCHLWFLICLFYVQVAISILSCIWHGYLRNLPILLMSSVSLLFFACVDDNFVNLYLCRLAAFVLLGLLCRQVMIRRMCFTSPLLLISLLAVALVLHVVGLGHVHAFVLDYLVVLFLICLFACEDVHFVSCKSNELLSGLSLGIYLMHPFFAAGVSTICAKYFVKCVPWWGVMAVWFADYGLALASAYFLSKMPYLKRIV